MNIHINKQTRFQSWEGRTIFGEYPVHIRPGNFTVTLLFHDEESIDNLRQILNQTLLEIRTPATIPTLVSARKKEKM
jgi:hypothetical protein